MYLESTSFEGRFEVFGMASEDDFVKVEVVRPTDDLAIGKLLGSVESGKEVSIVSEYL